MASEAMPRLRYRQCWEKNDNDWNKVHNCNNNNNHNDNNDDDSNACQPGLGACGASLRLPGRFVPSDRIHCHYWHPGLDEGLIENPYYDVTLKLMAQTWRGICCGK